MPDYNVCIAGAAGDGVKDAGIVLARLFASMGYRTFVYQEYESLIRGGHNASIVRASDKEIHSHRYFYDAFICLEDYVLKYHNGRLKGFLIYDSKFQCEYGNSFSIPMSQMVREEHQPAIFRNAVALGSFCYLAGIPLENLNEVFIREYGEKAKYDIILAREGYEFAEKNFQQQLYVERMDGKKPVLSGNEVIALGMVKAGLKCYFAYPMTPTSPILHLLAKQKLGVKAVQPESEIAAIMMAIGSAFAGKRSAVATSGGGFALMTESISLAAMAEVPVLIVEGQRSAPSTGMATFTAQQDLDFVLHPAHGEFPLLVASPITVSDSFYLAAELLNLAWKFQTPSIMLTDKHLVESYETVDVDVSVVKEEKIEIYDEETEEIFPRFRITDSGVSPYAVPPAMVKANSNEHDEFGITTDDAEIATAMYAKRMKKEEGIKKEVSELEPYRLYGEGKDTIITWGSNFGAVYEVAEELGYKVLAVRYLRPLILPELKGELIAVECNYSGLLARLVEREKGVRIRRVLRWDGRPFTPEELQKSLGAVEGLEVVE